MSGLVKHYQNTMQGIPQLSNEWGSMISLLDAVLVTGFNHVPILGLSKANTESITATINLGSGHGFIDRQVVRIAGSTNGWNGDYKVLSADTNTITVECTATHASVILGTATCFTAPLDFEIVHQTPVDSIEPKRAYRSTDLESLGLILLVHDFCVSGAAAAGAKFAKVGVVSGMTDIDTIVGNQMPFNAANPNANWGWDGTYHGWAKWYYRTATTTANLPDSLGASEGNTPFLIVGDAKSFIVETNQNAPLIGGFFDFFDYTLQSSNCCLIAAGLQGIRTQDVGTMAALKTGFAYIEYAGGSSGGSNSNLRGGVWFNRAGLAIYESCGAVLNLSTVLNGRSALDTNLEAMTYLPVIIGSTVIGVLPFLKITASRTNGVYTSLELGKYTNRYVNVNTEMIVKYAITLEVQ